MTFRRDFLAFTSGAMLAKTVLPVAARAEGEGRSASPDADLIAACDEYLHIQREFEAYNVSLPGDITDDDPAWAILDPLPGLRDQIATLRATTADGHFARTCCVAFHYLPHATACQDDPDGAAEDRFRAANLRDAVAIVRPTEQAGTLPATPRSGTVAHPDAELLALAEQFIAHEQSIQNIPCGADGSLPKPRISDMLAVQFDLASAMCTVQATTAEGIAARARCAVAHDPDDAFPMDDPATIMGMLVRSLIRDAAALGSPVGVAARPAVSPDAELLEVCAAFDALERAYIATFDGLPEDDKAPGCIAASKEQGRIYAKQEPLVTRMVALQPKTLAGHAARARSLALWEGDNPSYDSEGELFSERLTAAIVRDLIG